MYHVIKILNDKVFHDCRDIFNFHLTYEGTIPTNNYLTFAIWVIKEVILQHHIMPNTQRYMMKN
jgi:hypothetical protein